MVWRELFKLSLVSAVFWSTDSVGMCMAGFVRLFGSLCLTGVDFELPWCLGACVSVSILDNLGQVDFGFAAV